uniref:CHK kinase-like domain-containing protein n=1 Tax=Panagrolaimus sp. ES5 TaxID=591445 RepID=A0AC34GHB5_9BILA
MEDLTKRGKTLGYFDNVNLAQIKCFVRHLARMHKNILSIDPTIWRGKFLKGQMALVNFIGAFHAASGPFVEKCNRKDELKPLFDKYSKFMINRDYYLYVQKQAYKDLGLLPVIVHGDIYGGNLMFSINENGEIQNDIAAIIDWQQMREGSPMEDLARFLTNCCDGSIRRQAESFILEYYLECLEKEFGGDKTKVPYTLEQIKKAYNYSFIAQAFATVFMVQHMLPGVNASAKIKEAFYDFGT